MSDFVPEFGIETFGIPAAITDILLVISKNSKYLITCSVSGLNDHYAICSYFVIFV